MSCEFRLQCKVGGLRQLEMSVDQMTGNKDQAHDAIGDEALRWFVLLHSGDATDSDRIAHGHWMSADPLHLQAYMRLAAIWSDMDRLGDPRDKPSKRDRRLVGRRTVLVGGASAVALGAVAYTLPLGIWLSDYSTGTGEQKTVSLPDGSTANLDADTSISLSFTDRQRSIRLMRGRVYFDVAKDSTRPFVVHAHDGSTTALGTRFLVHEWGDGVTISVEESAVAVVAPDSSKAVVREGQDVSYDVGGGVGTPEKADIEADTAWRRGKLIFQDRPLSQVVSDINRYRPGVIRIVDTSLRTMRISGIFEIRNPDGVLDAITSALPIRSIRLTRYVVLLLAA